jgi:hypothetical protein
MSCSCGTRCGGEHYGDDGDQANSARIQNYKKSVLVQISFFCLERRRKIDNLTATQFIYMGALMAKTNSCKITVIF